MGLREKKCDVIILLFPLCGKEEGFCCLEDFSKNPRKQNPTVQQLMFSRGTHCIEISVMCVWGFFFMMGTYSKGRKEQHPVTLHVKWQYKVTVQLENQEVRLEQHVH